MLKQIGPAGLNSVLPMATLTMGLHVQLALTQQGTGSNLVQGLGPCQWAKLGLCVCAQQSAFTPSGCICLGDILRGMTVNTNAPANHFRLVAEAQSEICFHIIVGPSW